MKKERNILELLDQVQAIARTGLSYTDSEYDRERYRTLLDLAAGEYSDIYQLSKDQVLQSWQQEIGYITPKIGVNGAVFDESGKMLLEKRVQDQTIGIPGGWVDVGLSPEETVKKELLEEAGLVVEIIKLIGVHTRTAGNKNVPHGSVHLFYLCKKISGEIQVSHESEAVGFWDHTQVTNWHEEHGEWASEAYVLRRAA